MRLLNQNKSPMFSTKKLIEAIYSLSIIIIIIAVTTIDYKDISFENNKLSYLEIGISSILLFGAFIIKFRNVRTNLL